MELNYEQNRLINSPNMGASLIRGVAGSGKTTVAVYRLPVLAHEYCRDRDDTVLMVTYNKSLVEYTKYIYESIDEGQLSFFHGEKEENRVEFKNIDKLLFSYFLQYCGEKHKRYTVIREQEKDDYIKAAISQARQYCEVTTKNTFTEKDVGFLKKEIAWMKAGGYTKLEVYQTIDRTGRTAYARLEKEGPQRLAKNSEKRRLIYYIYKFYNHELHQKQFVDFEDVVIIAKNYLEHHEVKKYTHILVDECQDLSAMQLECLKLLWNWEKDYASMLLMADTAQSIYPVAWMSQGRSFSSIGIDIKGRSSSLTKNYRTTTQIAQAAFSLLEHDLDITEDENYVKPSLLDKQGSYPVLQKFDSLQEELIFVKEKIVQELSKKYDRREIAVVARTKKILVEAQGIFGKELPADLYIDGLDFSQDRVRLLTMHSIKGLEFKVIFLVGLSEHLIPNQNLYTDSEDASCIDMMERKLLYVGMTRATERLYMSYYQKPSKFLSQIDASCLKKRECSKIKNYQEIEEKDYIFRNKLEDSHRNEEKVRQWMLKELKESYGYPESLLDIEYRVKNFSKTGYADIVVYIYRNNVKIPYILIEVKKKGSGIQEATEQLQTYMAVVPSCVYGIVSDANKFEVLNRQGEFVDDIPAFDSSMQLSSVTSKIYLDLNLGKTKTFKVDSQCQQELYIEEQGQMEVLKGSRLCKIPLYTNIAAGQPIEIVQEIRDTLLLPHDWMKHPLELFALTVKGDSMVNATIEDGDIVILEKSAVADNGQITAVDLDGNTTLKRFRRMGSNVLLMPENNQYEPIVVSEGQFRILGIGVGVLKK